MLLSEKVKEAGKANDANTYMQFTHLNPIRRQKQFIYTNYT